MYFFEIKILKLPVTGTTSKHQTKGDDKLDGGMKEMMAQSFWASPKRIKSGIPKHALGIRNGWLNTTPSREGHFLKCLNLHDIMLQACANR